MKELLNYINIRIEQCESSIKELEEMMEQGDFDWSMAKQSLSILKEIKAQIILQQNETN